MREGKARRHASEGRNFEVAIVRSGGSSHPRGEVPISVMLRWVAVLLVATFPALALAHGGGLDAYGCHRNKKLGNYHCHRGPFDGQTFASKDEMLQALQAGATVPEPTEPADPATPSVIAGRASVIDGDTIEVHGQRVRLHGIDAPESGQTCDDADGQPYRCGQRAASALDDLIAGRPVSCEQRDVDRYGRIVAVCAAAGVDVAEAMVREGWALAYRQYSTDYVDEEAQAEAEGAGMWAGTFVAPWDFRHGTDGAAPAAQGECIIKGNISSSGERIYHVPGGQYYNRTKIDEGKGERWFCSEAEAVAAGWRRAKR